MSNDRFTITAELDEVFEVTYQGYRNYGDTDTDEPQQHVRSFPSEAKARQWIAQSNEYILSFVKVTKLDHKDS